MSTDRTKLNISVFCLLALIWSGSFINIKIVVEHLPPVFATLLRVFISFATLTLLFSIARKSLYVMPKHLWRIWLASWVSQAIPFALLFYGERFIAPALAGIINSTVSIWALLLGTLFFRDFSQWTPTRVIGLFLGFIGVLAIFMPALSGQESKLIGVIAVGGMAISYAIGALLNQHLILSKINISLEQNLFHQHLASVALLIVASLSLETWPTATVVFTTQNILALLYLGTIATALAWIIYFYLLRQFGPVRTTSVMYLVPILAITWDWLFLGLSPTFSELVGISAILPGVILIQWNRNKPVIKNFVAKTVSSET